jgi:folate-dependent phosphoribosylglycinamide formyltransferase PurN
MANIVLLGRDSLSTRLLFAALSKAGHTIIWHEERRDDRLELLRRRAKRFGLVYVLSQLVFQIFQKVIFKFSKSRVKEIVGDLDALYDFEPLKVSKNLNNTSLSYIAEGNADLVVLSGTRILSIKTLNSFNAVPVVNIHAGVTPKYRGVHGGYWALVNCDAGNFGATLHFVDSGIDTGGVISHVRVTPERDDNFTTYPLLQQKAAIKVLLDVIPDVVDGTVDLNVQGNYNEESLSNIWTHPTIFQYIANYVKFGVK